MLSLSSSTTSIATLLTRSTTSTRDTSPVLSKFSTTFSLTGLAIEAKSSSTCPLDGSMTRSCPICTAHTSIYSVSPHNNCANAVLILLTRYASFLDRLLKELDNLGAVLVAASHNNYPYVAIKDRLDGLPSRFGDPNAAEGESIKNLIVVSGINQNSQVSMLNPYASWLALAPGYRVSVADASGGFNVDDGASLGKDPHRHHLWYI